MAFKALMWVIPAVLLRPGSCSGSSIDSSTSGTIPKPECDDSKEVSFWRDTTAGILYVEAADSGQRGGCATIDDIWDALGGDDTSAPLYPVDPDTNAYACEATGTWLLKQDLYVQDGITLQVWGPDSGGHVSELRLLSNPAFDDTNATVINLRAYGGSLDFENTRVVGWDTVNNAYDTEMSDGRSSISAITEVTDESACDAEALRNMGEARMDVVNSTMAYLGTLVWKVNGFCSDDSANVYGNVYDSSLDHMNTAVFMLGNQQGDIRRNTLSHFSLAGIGAVNSSDTLTIHDNVFLPADDALVLYGISINGSTGSSVQNNVLFGKDVLHWGIYLESGSDYAVVKNNCLYDTRACGICVRSGSNAISDNKIDTASRGIYLVDSHDNLVDGNDVTVDPTNGLYALQIWAGENNVFESNTITSDYIFKSDGSYGTDFINNNITVAGTAEWTDSTHIVVTGNVGFNNINITLEGYVCFDETDEVSLETAICEIF